MASWTPIHSRILSLLLDQVVGTQYMIAIRQDYCKIYDCIISNTTRTPKNTYFTGSKSEGLNILGSDRDFMKEINNEYSMKVIQSLNERDEASPHCTFFASTENVHPGFVLLKEVRGSVVECSPRDR